MTTISLKAINPNNRDQDIILTLDIISYEVTKIELAIATKCYYETLESSEVLTETLAQNLFYILSNRYIISNKKNVQQLKNMMLLLKCKFTTETSENKSIVELIQSDYVGNKDRLLSKIKEKWDSFGHSLQMAEYLEYLMGEVITPEHNG